MIVWWVMLWVQVALAKPDNTYRITDFGAVSESGRVNTKAIQAAIDKAHSDGGGKVIVPFGTYLTGGIELKSKVELHLEVGAILLGSTHPADYKHINQHRRALIMSDGAHHIAISGKGTVDGQGRKLALTIDSLHHAGVSIDPKYNYRRNRPNEDHRVELVSLVKSKNISISGVTFRNASCWVTTFDQCEDLSIDAVAIESRAFWNNDGMDIIDCRRVRITNSRVNVADDGICLKSHLPDYANDDIYIANCTIRSSASAVKFGTGSFGGFKNVVVENIKVFDTFRSAIAIETVDGGDIENIRVSGITAINTGNPIFIRRGHRKGDKPGVLRNVLIENIRAEVPFGRPDLAYDMRGPEVNFFHNPFPSSVAGIPGYPIEDVTIKNVEIVYPGRASKGMAYVPLSRLEAVPEKEKDYPEFSMFGELPAWGFYVRHVSGMLFENIRIRVKEEDFRPAFVFDDVDGLRLQTIEVENDPKKETVVLKNTRLEQIDESLKSNVVKY